MIICRTCNIPMQSVMSFSQNKHDKFDRCPKCFCETKHQKINDNELTFGEVLHKEINKRK